MTDPELKTTRSREFSPTDLTDDILLVVPDDMLRHSAVASVRDAVGKVGRPPETIPQGRFRPEQFRERHVIACGNLANNRAIQRLYTARCCFVDTLFPGANGYLVKSISDPFGYGPNCIVAGASSDEGLAAGLGVFTDIVAAGSGCLDRVHAASSGPEMPRPPDASEINRMVRDDLKIWGTGWSASPFRGGRLLTYLWRHYLTDHPVWARAAVEILKGSIEPWRAECRAHPEAYHCFFNLHLYIHLWDLVEDNPLFTREDRLGAVTMFAELLRHLMKLSYVSEEVNPSGEIRQNHTTFIGLNLAVGGDYMTRRHGIGEFRRAREIASRIFEGQMDCYKPDDDGGVGYVWHAPQETLSYSLYRDDDRYLTGGHVADLCKLAVVTTDNMRSECGYGDTSGYSAFSTDGWEARLWPLMVSTWYRPDPGHLWTLNWLGEGKRPPTDGALHGLYSAVEYVGDRFAIEGCAPEAPRDLLGICVMDMPDAVLSWVRRYTPQAHHPDPRRRYFDKLSLRRNFEPGGEYLLLEGIGTTCHGHEDTNAIVRLTWNNRAWLADGDYIRAAPRFHNSVTVMRDGVGVLESPGDGVVIPPLASLSIGNDGAELATLRSEAAGYNGVDWQRDIFWRKGRYMVVMDRLRCIEAGNYRLQCLWRTVGDTALEAEGVRIRQEGEEFHIRNADGSSQEIVPDPHVKSRWGSYPHSDGTISVLHQRTGCTLDAGTSFTFLNLLTPDPDIRIERIGPDAVRVTDGDEVALLGAGTIELDGLQLSGSMFGCLVRGNRTVLNGVERLGGRAVDSDERELDDPELAARIRRAPEASPAGLPAARPPVSGGLTERWRREFPHRIRHVCVSDDGKLLLAYGTEVACLCAATGETVWSRCIDAEGGASRVHLSDIDGDGNPEAMMGTEDSQLIVLEGDSGVERWRREMANMFNRGTRVSAIAVADLEGNGDLSVLAGTEGWFVNAFANDGSPRWAEWFRYHAITALQVTDTDGDGRAEVLAGTEYYTPLTVHNFDGSFRWSTFEQVGSHGNATTPRRGIGLKHMVLCDLDRDGVLEVVYGTEDGWIYAVKPQDGEEIWHVNLVGEITGLVAMDDVIIASCEFGMMYGFDFIGNMEWHRNEAQWIHALAESGGTIAAAANRREIRTYDVEGHCQGSLELPANVTSLSAAQSGFVCADEQGVSMFDLQS